MHKCYQVRWHLWNNWLVSSQMLFLKTQGTSIACIFRKQNIFIQLQLLMSLSMNQFVQWFAFWLMTPSVIIYKASAHHLPLWLQPICVTIKITLLAPYLRRKTYLPSSSLTYDTYLIYKHNIYTFVLHTSRLFKFHRILSIICHLHIHTRATFMGK